MAEKIKLDGLEAACFQFETDRILMDRINRVPGVAKALGWLADREAAGLECESAGGAAFRVDELSLPDLWEVYRQTCETLALSEMPPLFVCQGSEVNAFTLGVKRSIVYVTNYAVNNCSKEELRFIFGHELGHILCSHVKLLKLFHYIDRGGDVAMMFEPIMALAKLGFVPLARTWARAAEVSADRAGLLACQDFEVACAAFLRMMGFPHAYKMSGSPSANLFRQLDCYKAQYGEFGLARRCWKDFARAYTADHPRTVERVICLQEWLQMGCFDELVQATPEERHRIAMESAGEKLRYELLVQLVLDTVEYLCGKFGLERRVVFPDIRRAYLRREPIRGCAADRLLMSDLIVRLRPGNRLEYELQLYVRSTEGKPLRATIGVQYDEDWAFAPQAFRDRFMRDRVAELKVGIYQRG